MSHLSGLGFALSHEIEEISDAPLTSERTSLYTATRSFSLEDLKDDELAAAIVALLEVAASLRARETV